MIINTGRNRKQFVEYFDIPDMSLLELERGKGREPSYLPRLLEYYVRMHEMMEKKEKDD